MSTEIHRLILCELGMWYDTLNRVGNTEIFPYLLQFITNKVCRLRNFSMVKNKWFLSRGQQKRQYKYKRPVANPQSLLTRGFSQRLKGPTYKTKTCK